MCIALSALSLPCFTLQRRLKAHVWEEMSHAYLLARGEEGWSEAANVGMVESYVFSYSQVRIGVENLKRSAHAIRFPDAEGEMCGFDSLALAQAEQNGDALHAAEVGHAVFSGFLSKIPKPCYIQRSLFPGTCPTIRATSKCDRSHAGYASNILYQILFYITYCILP